MFLGSHIVYRAQSNFRRVSVFLARSRIVSGQSSFGSNFRITQQLSATYWYNWNNWMEWKCKFISFSIRSNVIGQHDRQNERLFGQFPNQSWHCPPLTARYFEPWYILKTLEGDCGGGGGGGGSFKAKYVFRSDLSLTCTVIFFLLQIAQFWRISNKLNSYKRRHTVLSSIMLRTCTPVILNDLQKSCFAYQPLECLLSGRRKNCSLVLWLVQLRSRASWRISFQILCHFNY